MEHEDKLKQEERNKADKPLLDPRSIMPTWCASNAKAMSIVAADAANATPTNQAVPSFLPRPSPFNR